MDECTAPRRRTSHHGQTSRTRPTRHTSQIGRIVLGASAAVVALSVAVTAMSLPHPDVVSLAAAAPPATRLAATSTTGPPPASSTTTVAPPTTEFHAETAASLSSPTTRAVVHPTTTTTAPVRHVAAAVTTTTARPVPTTTAPPPATAAPVPPSAAAVLACIRQRESGGNYAAVSANGVYRGAYQFSQGTWDGAARLAGRPDLVGRLANTVAPADQDAVALAEYEAAGLAPWVVTAPDPARPVGLDVLVG